MSFGIFLLTIKSLELVLEFSPRQQSITCSTGDWCLCQGFRDGGDLPSPQELLLENIAV